MLLASEWSRKYLFIGSAPSLSLNCIYECRLLVESKTLTSHHNPRPTALKILLTLVPCIWRSVARVQCHPSSARLRESFLGKNRLEVQWPPFQEPVPQYTQVGFSSIPIFIVGAIGLGFLTFNGNMPVGSASVAIAPACHRPESDVNAAYLPVNRGKIYCENSQARHFPLLLHVSRNKKQER